MSTAILKGNASGTGSMTLESPATNSNRTVTVPDVDGQMMVSGNQPAFSAYIGTGHSLTAFTQTKLQYNTERFDTNSNFDTSNYRFTPTVAGYYQVSAAYTGAAPQVGDYQIIIFKNSAPYSSSGFGGSNPSSGGYVQNPSISTLVYMNGTTDYLEVYTYVGITQTCQNSISTSFFTGVLVRAA